MAELKEPEKSGRVGTHDQTTAERQDEQDEIDNFNQNTDYDASASLREDPASVLREETAAAQGASDDLAMAHFIVSNRIYDVLLALLKTADADVARDLLELHSSGVLLGTAPSWNSTFLTDVMNSDD